MQIKRYNLSNILLYTIIAVCLYLIQRIACFELPDPNYPFLYARELHYYEYLIVFGGIVILTIWYFIIEWKRRAVRFHWPLIAVLTGLFVMSVVNIFLAPSTFTPTIHLQWMSAEYKEIPVTITVSLEQRFLYVFSSFAVLYLAYLLIWVLPRKIRFTRQLDWIMYIVIALAIVAMVFSYIVEFDKYKNFFETLSDESKELPLEIVSFLNNKNVFGFWMLFATFACLYLHHTNNRWWFLLLTPLFLFQTVLLSARTSAVICTLVLLVYFIGLFALQYKKRLVFSIVLSCVLATLILTVAHLFFIHHFDNNFMSSFFHAVDKFTNKYSFYNLIHYDQVSGRDHQHSLVYSLLSKDQWATGMGFGIFNYYFGAASALSMWPYGTAWGQTSPELLQYTYKMSLTDSPHSIYYQLIGTCGIVGLVFVGLLLLYVIYAAVITFKKHRHTSLLCLLLLAVTLVTGIAESVSLLVIGPIYINSVFLTIIVTTPVLSNYYHDRHPSENIRFVKNTNRTVIKLSKIKDDSLITKSLYFFLTPVVIVCCIAMPLAFGVNFTNRLWVFILMVSAGAVYLIAPPIVQLFCYRKIKYHSFILNVALPYHALLSVLGGFYCLYGILIAHRGTTAIVLLMFFALILYFATFSLSRFYKPLAGIITWLLDLASARIHKRHKRQITISKEEDSYTLQEKFFRLFIPKRFK